MRFVHSFFFGNYFYGLCMAALSVEASLQQRYPLNPLHYYAAVFLATVFFYTAAYITEGPGNAANPRSMWYAKNYRLVKSSQAIFAAILAAYGLWIVLQRYASLAQLAFTTWLAILLFPLSGLLYYGLSGKGIGNYNLRRIGWLKPFTIGFTWAGLVTVYPVLFYHLQKDLPYNPTLVGAFLFLKNFMFITVLCIMFDIKDYAVDHNLQIKTFVVTNGLRRTIFAILLPLCFLGLGSFIYYALTLHFHPVKILLNIIPFALLIAVAYSMYRRRSILYYLIIIDGLMLAKAVCGTIAMTFF
ncbi:MAG TPA: hypothetical protein VM871_04475 [Flavisolibacter sp.]|nr:hypothetical protein [Flavisolibacter sp.]